MLIVETVKTDVGDFGGWVRTRAKDLNLSINAVARQAGLSPSLVHDIAKGHRARIKRSTFEAIQGVLGGWPD